MSVSVIVPCYNAEPYLAQAVRSALDQTESPVEVIIVDDGSTDASLDIALSLQETEGDCVRVLSQHSGMATRTRNLGAAAARGDALLFLDADDVIGPDTLGALLDVLSGGEHGVAICPWYRLDRVADRWVKRPPSCRPRLSGQDALSGWLTGWYHPPCSVMWTRDGFERAGRFEERWSANDDGDLMMRALVLGVPLGETASGAGYYRRIPSGGTLSGQRFTERGLRSRVWTIRKVAALLEDQGRVDDYRRSLAVAFERIAADAGDHPAISARCDELAARYGPPASARWQHAALDAMRTYRRRVGFRLDLGCGQRSDLTDTAEEVDLGVRSPRYTDAGSGRGEPERLQLPRVSVILPTFQRADVLPRAVESVLSQSFADFELLVIDDGSTDDTSAVVARYDDDRVRYLAQPVNRGVSAARNRGLREAQGDLIAFLDSDDEWLPGKLELQVAKMSELADDIGLLYGGVENVERDGKRRLKMPSHRGDLYPLLLQATNVVHGTSGVMMRRRVVATVGFFDEGIPAIEDYDYWVRAARFFQFEYLDVPLIRYDDSNAPDRKSLAVEDNHQAREWFFRKHQAEMRHLGVEHLFLVESARRHLKRSQDTSSARRVILRAALRAPLATEVRRMLFAAFVSEPLRRSNSARALARALRGSRR